MKTKILLLFISLLISSGVSAQNWVWNPAGNNPSTGLFSEAANWNQGTVPGSTNKVVFNVGGAEDCVVDDTQSIKQLVQGDGGPGETLRIVNGGDLTLATDWTGLGYNNTAKIVVEAGGSITFVSHLWMSFQSGGEGTLEINGGTATVNGNIGIAHNAVSTEGGTILVTGGTLNLAQLPAANMGVGALINVAGGSIIITGDRRTDMTTLITAEKLVGYGVTGAAALTVSFDGEANKTTITGVAETIPPTIVSYSPRDGAVQAVISRGVEIEFSEAMNTANTEGAISISGVADEVYAWDGNTVTVTSASMAASTVYTVTIGTGTTDLAGNALGEEASFSFTTSSGRVTTVWNPAANSHNSAWEADASWTNGVADGDYLTILNVNNAVECVLSDERYIDKLKIDSEDSGALLRIADGGVLTTSTIQTAEIGTGRYATLTVETGGVVSFGQHMWIGNASGVGNGTLNVNGGTVNVGAMTGLGWNNSGGIGYININSGEVNLSQWNTTLSLCPGSIINIENGTLNIKSGLSAQDFKDNYVTGSSYGKITAYNGNGTIDAVKDGNWVTLTATPETTPPTVESIAPTADATDISILSDIVIEFSELMDNASVEGALSVSPTISNQALDWTDETLTISGVDLTNEQVYTVTISTAATDVVGNALAAYSSSFTTVSATAPPTILSVLPADDAVNVPLSPSISISFSKEMKSTETQAAFSVSPDITNKGFTWDGEELTITGDDMGLSTEYTVTIGTGAQAADDSFLASAYVFSFTTVVEIDPPTVEEVSPADGSDDVALDTSISIEFSEAMDQDAVEAAITIDPERASLVYSWDSNTLTISGANLSEDVEYTITIGTDATDAVGNAIESAYEFSFTSYPGTQDNVWELTTETVATGLWNEATNWSLGVVADGDFDALFNVANGSECKLDDSRSIVQLITGWGAAGGTLRIADGGNLTTTEGWSGVGYDNTGTLIVETGGVANFGGHLWIGFNDGADGILQIDGGEVTVNGDFGLATESSSDGTGTLNLNSGTLNLDRWTTVDNIITGSSMDITAGTLIIGGEYVSKIEGAAEITAYGGTGTITATYDEDTDKTTVTAAPEAIAPTVESISPTNGTEEVAIASDIVIEFSELMDECSVETALSVSPEIENQVLDWTDETLTISGDDLTLITEYTVTIGVAATDTVGNALASEYSSSFKTINEKVAPTISSISPASGADDVAISSDIVIEFSELMNTTSVEDAISVTPSLTNAAYNWADAILTISSDDLEYFTEYTVTIGTAAADLADNVLAENYEASFTTAQETTPPTVASTSPKASDVDIAIDADIVIEFSELMDEVSVESAISIAPSIANAAFSWTDETLTIAGDDMEASTAYTVTIATSSTDAVGNALATEYEFAFTTENEKIAPTVASISPAADATEVAFDEAIVIEFSELMDTDNVEGAISIEPSISNTSFDWVDETLTISGDDLDALTSYTVSINTEATDAVGNALAEEYISSFTTMNEQIPPTVNSVSPADSETDIAANSAIVFEFSELMDETSVESALTVSPEITNMTFEWDGVEVSIVGDEMEYSTEYTVSLGTGAQDLAGNALESEYIFGFTTVSEDAAPTITEVAPEDGSTSVAIDAEIAIKFSKSMNELTAEGAISISPDIDNLAYTWDGSTVNISGDDLSIDTEYTVTIGTSAESTDGKLLETEYLYSFTTILELTPPTVVSIAPADSDVDIAIDADIVIEFSELMDEASVESAISISPSIDNLAFGWTDETLTISGDDMTLITDYTVTVGIEATDVLGNALASEYSSEFTTSNEKVAPTISNITPTSDAVDVDITYHIVIEFSELMNNTSVEDAIAVNPSLTNAQYNWTDETLTISSDVLANATAYSVTIGTAATDLAGNELAEAYQSTFTTVQDTTPPTVASTTPADSDVDIEIDAGIVIEFSELMDQASVESVISLEPGISNTTFEWMDEILTISGDDMDLITLYTVTIGTGAKGTDGNIMAAAYSFSFTTENEKIAPTIVSRTPANTSTDVALDADIVIEFSELMNTSSVEEVIFIEPALGNVTYSWDGVRVTISGDELALITEYTVTIGTGAQDLVGNALASASSFTFTTANETISPTIVMTSPKDETDNVAIDADIIIEFSEAMNELSVEEAMSITPAISNLTFAWDNLTLTISGDNLTESTTYDVVIGTSSQDMVGNQMSSAFSFAFTTIQSVTVTAIGDNHTLLNVYPNPASTELNVQLNKNVESLTLISLLGTVVYTRNNLQSQVRLIMNVSDYEKGLYFLRVQNSEGGTKVLRVVIE